MSWRACSRHTELQAPGVENQVDQCATASRLCGSDAKTAPTWWKALGPYRWSATQPRLKFAHRSSNLQGRCFASAGRMSRVIVITGGTAGVGRAVARRFACEGNAVAVLARGRDGIATTVAEIDRL